MKMNRLMCVLIALLTTSIFIKAQVPGEFVGISFNGGNAGAGTVYSFTSEGNNQKAIYHFTSKNIGENPQKSDLCLASNGKFYGVTTNGGTYQAGVLFEYDPATKEYISRYVFDKINGENPYGGVIEVNGNLFGTTRYGGSNGAGTIFTYTLSTRQFVKIYNCLSTGPVGYNPCGALVLGSGGKIYGITRYGGGNGLGTIFEIDPATTAIKKIIDVSANMGRSFAGLMEAGNGKFYGVTVDGGANNSGTLFEFNAGTPSITKKIDFDGAGNGKSPYGSLVQAANGKVYGTTSEGGANGYGTLFEYSPDDNTIVKKIDFGSAGNGQNPYSALYKAPSGSLFGVTSTGGKNSVGVLFKYNVNSGTLTKLYDFNAPLGYNPQCGISRVGSVLYSLTMNGGKTGNGTIFKYDTLANVYSKEIEFSQPDVNGSRPYGGFEKGLNEKYYFVTSVGGTNGVGTLNIYDRNTKQVSRIYDFEESTGSEPYVEPTLVENKKLYGTTFHGGVYGNGTIYEYDLSTGAYKKLYDFVNSTSGISPAGSKLVYASNKKIYGLTLWGGANGTGVLFEFNPATIEYTVKASMPVSPGYATIGTWSGMMEYNGKLYFVTTVGGSAKSGILFEYDPVTATLTNKVEFTSAIGSNPYGGISVFGKKFYGTCNSGGANNAGSIFEYNPADNTLTIKYSFTSANKSVYNSPSRLNLSGNNKFYGSTMYGGQNGYGGIFEFDPSTSDFKVLASFDAVNGHNCPTGASLIEFCDPISITQQTQSTTYKTGDVLSLSADATGTNLSYKWMKNNSVVSSTKTFSKVLSSADFGKYICKVTNGCRIVDSDTVRITLATGISDTKKADYRIYPNPCKGILYVQSGTGEIEIFNSLGQSVKKQILESSPAEMKLSALDNGVYYYRLKSGHQTFSGKFVLAKE